MKPIRTGTFLALALTVTACAQAVANKEDLLTAAGFSFRPADTPQRISALHALPPHKFVHQERHGRTVWIYADPTICGCLYVGDQQAYSNYKQEVFAKRLANEQQMTAEMNENAAMQMDWGPWGPWAPYY